MDRLDLSILRWMYPGGLLRFGGLDPRISPAQIAIKVGVSRETVRSRVGQWRKSGAFGGITILPHPSLFGAKFEERWIHVPDSDDRIQLIEKLELVPGVAHILDHDPNVLALFVETESWAADSALKLVLVPGRVELPESSDTVDHGRIGTLPALQGSPSDLEWRVLDYLRRNPLAAVGAIARHVNISVKTASRCRDRLIESHAALACPTIDYTKSTGSVLFFNYFTGRSADLGAISRAVHERLPGVVPFAPYRLRGDPKSPNLELRPDAIGWCLSFLAPIRSAAEADPITRSIARFAGSGEFAASFLLRERYFPQAFDALFASASHSRTQARGSGRPTR